MPLGPGTIRHAVELSLVAFLAGCGSSSEKDSGGGNPGCVGSWNEIVGTALSPRVLAAAVWTGSEVMVWGGRKTPYTSPWNSELNDGASFDPVTGVLAKLPSAGLPRQTMSWGEHDGKLVVFAGNQVTGVDQSGQNNVVVFHKDGFLMDASGVTTPIPEVPDFPWQDHATVTAEALLSISYEPKSLCRYPFTASTWLCEPVTEYFDGPLGGWLLDSQTIMQGDEAFTWGGSVDGKTDPQTAGFRFSFSTHVWTPMSTLGAPAPRFVPQLHQLGDSLFVAAGMSHKEPSGGWTPFLDSAGLYDLETDSWITMTLPDIELVENFAYTVQRAGDRLVLWNHGHRRGAVLDLTTSTWSEICQANAMPENNHGASAVWTGSEIVVLGGAASSQDQIGARLSLP